MSVLEALKNNGFETIDYIKYYLDEYKKLNELILDKGSLISNKLYSNEFIL